MEHEQAELWRARMQVVAQHDTAARIQGFIDRKQMPPFAELLVMCWLDGALTGLTLGKHEPDAAEAYLYACAVLAERDGLIVAAEQLEQESREHAARLAAALCSGVYALPEEVTG